MIRYTKVVAENCLSGDNIYTYLKRSGYSENFLKNLRKEFGFIKLNDKDVFITEKIKSGDIICLNSNPNKKTKIEDCFIPLDVLYEDDYIIAVNKPSGLATMPTRSHFYNNLSGAIAYYMKKKDPNFVVRIINRLDKDTAGVVIVAKDSLTCKALNNSDAFDKTYYALLTGKIDKEITVDKKISTQTNEYGFNSNKRIISEQGKTAITHIFPIQYYENSSDFLTNAGTTFSFDDLLVKPEVYTLCKIKIEHGRTHQIRVHSAYIAHPLLGDAVYGNESSLIKHSALLCKEICFIHPITKEAIQIECDFPQDFKSLINL